MPWVPLYLCHLTPPLFPALKVASYKDLSTWRNRNVCITAYSNHPYFCHWIQDLKSFFFLSPFHYFKLWLFASIPLPFLQLPSCHDFLNLLTIFAPCLLTFSKTLDIFPYILLAEVYFLFNSMSLLDLFLFCFFLCSLMQILEDITLTLKNNYLLNIRHEWWIR